MVREGDNLREVEREERAARRDARQRVRVAEAEARLTKERTRLAEREREESLARQGLKRSFWTGRVVPVRGSKRARPHERRLPY